ncbi:cytochrome P450 [Suillus cothurnatus]|nr:cytochrome P450 [Suillus cothurnatus]
MGAYIGLLMTFACAAVYLCRIFAAKPLPGLPVMGTKDPLLSILSCITFLVRAPRVLRESYDHFCDLHDAFQLRLIGEWRVVAIGQESVMAILGSKFFPFLPYVAESCQIGFTVHPSLHTGDIHRPYIRQMMSELDNHLPQVLSEIEVSFQSTCRSGSGIVNVMEAMSEAVFRSINTLIVGPDLAGNPNYRKKMLRGLPKIFFVGLLLRGVPQRFRHIVHKLFCQGLPACSGAQAMIIDEIRDRKAAVKNSVGPWDSHFSDALSWAVRDGIIADDEEILAAHVVLLNLGGVFTTTMAVTQTVINLLTRPQCLESVQSEVRTVVKDGLVTAETLNQLPLLDSFMKESWRLMDMGAFHITRMAKVDATLPNGITVPKGSTISIPTKFIHQSSKFYQDPMIFDATRFVQNSHTRPCYLATTSPEFLFFGYGKVVCPGRHIAIRIMKSIIVRMLLDYDIALCNAKYDPVPRWYGYFCVPDSRAMVSFKERYKDMTVGSRDIAIR